MDQAEATPESGIAPAAASFRDRRAREGRVWRMALLASLAIHVLIFVFGPRGSVLLSPFSAAGPRSGDDVAAEGAMEAVALRSAPPEAPRPIVVPDVFLEVPETPVVDFEPEPEVDPDPPELPEPGSGASAGADAEDRGDAGIEGATGQGDAGTTEAGRFRVVPPIPRGMIMPPPAPRGLQGTKVEVWVFVDAQGRVVADSTRLEPATRDRRLNQQLIREAGEWVFEPARREGEPESAWFVWEIQY